MERGHGEKKPKFAKVLMPGFDKKLSIPPKFVQTHLAKENHNSATILSPLGKPWHITLTRDAQYVYFDNGWQEFAKSHDLLVGHFLIFRYEGNMVFTLTLVFDTTGCLKRHYYNVKSECSHQIVPHNVSDNKMLRRSPRFEEYENAFSPPPKVHYLSTNDIKRRKSRTFKTVKIENARRITPLIYQPKWKPELVRKIAQSNSIRKEIYMPRGFCINSDLVKEQKIMLRDADHRMWSAEFKVMPNYCYISKLHEFFEAYNLQCGDQCIFKFIGKGLMSVEVVKNSQIVAVTDA